MLSFFILLMKRLLVVVVDIDNDLGEKAKLRAPIIGRENVVKAATKLALADAEDVDSNALFKAVSIYDKLKKEGKEVEIVVLAGHKNLGIKASTRVARQLDKVLKEFPAESAIVVSDSSSDDIVLPIIQSRLKIDAIEKVFVRQAKELEKTYFVLLEKLKDPYYSKILLGIPALILLLISIAYAFNIKAQYLGIIVGTLLLIKGFSLDEWFGELLKSFYIESSKTLASVFYAFVTILLFVSLYASYQAYISSRATLKGLELYAYILDAFITPFSLVIFFALAVKLIDLYTAKKSQFTIIGHIHLIITFLLVFAIIKATLLWIINLYPPFISFKELLLIIVGALALGYLSSYYFNAVKSDILASMKLKDKEVYDVEGNHYGKVSSVDIKRERLRIISPFGKSYTLPISRVVDVGESLIIE